MSTNQLNPIKLYSGPFTPMQSKHPPSQDKEPMWEFYQIQDTLTESLGDKGQKKCFKQLQQPDFAVRRQNG